MAISVCLFSHHYLSYLVQRISFLHYFYFYEPCVTVIGLLHYSYTGLDSNGKVNRYKRRKKK